MKRRICALGTWLIALGLAAGPVAAQDVVPAPAADAPAETVARSAAPRVFAEVLFIRPTLDDTAFVLSSPVSTTFPNGHRESDEFEYEPAFRIGAGYTIAESGRSIELSYSRLESEATETLAGDFLWATVGHPDFVTSFENYTGSASADIDADYQQIDLHVTQPWQVSGMDLGLLFGLEWADFRVGESSGS